MEQDIIPMGMFSTPSLDPALLSPGGAFTMGWKLSKEAFDGVLEMARGFLFGRTNGFRLLLRSKLSPPRSLLMIILESRRLLTKKLEGGKVM